MTSLLNNRH